MGFPSEDSTHFRNRSMTHRPLEGEPLRARGAPVWELEAPARRAAARVHRQAAAQTAWRRILLIFPRSAGSPASTRLRDSPPTICGNCRSATTNAGSLETLHCALSPATGNGAETGPSQPGFPSPLDL